MGPNTACDGGPGSDVVRTVSGDAAKQACSLADLYDVVLVVKLMALSINDMLERAAELLGA